jgi:hypothetical protein
MKFTLRFHAFLLVAWMYVSVVSLLLFLYFLGNGSVHGLVYAASIIMLPLFLAAWSYITFRLWFFRNRLMLLFKHLLFNDYSTGIRSMHLFDDEVSEITATANKVCEQLATYDRLRAERTGLSYRAMNTLFRIVSQGIIIADMEKKQFRLNPYLQALFGVNQETFSFDAIEKQEENTRFFRTFIVAVLKDKIKADVTTSLILPQRTVQKTFIFQMMPLKDDKEVVKVAVLFAEEEQTAEE